MGEEASVLIVIEDEQLCQSLGEVLEAKGGYRVEKARTGGEAEAKAEARFFHVALLDVQLPDVEGVELLRRLKEIHPATKGIILGSNVTAQVIMKAVQEGAFACLAKPPNLDELLQTTQKALEKQQLELEEQDRERMKLISAIAHELRSPLTSILLSVNLLADEIPQDSQETLSTLADNIAHSARRIDSWVQDLLDLAKLRVGDYQLQLGVVDPGPVLQKAVATVHPSIQANGQSLSLEVVEPLPLAQIDEYRVEQIVTELLAIASKFTPSGGRIVLRARKQEAGLLVEIQDSAPAIPQEVLKPLSYPYHRIETDKRQLARLGLGLALSRHLIALHGGKMWVDSNTQQGNVFGFTLPPVEGPLSQKQ